MLQLATENLNQVANLMQTEGAFAWWYADLVDGEGRGLVLIWSFGLPFLPGSRRRPKPSRRPSLAVALYERGHAVFYALQTFAPEDAAMSPCGRMRFGRSRIDLRPTGDHVSLKVDVDLDVPGGGRLMGTLRASGRRCVTPDGPQGPEQDHRWAPILVAQSGSARFEATDGSELAIDGRVYVDSNGSDRPLHELGIADWRWGRVALPDRDLIYYFVDPDHDGADPIRHVIEARPDGRLTRHDVTARWRGPRRSIYGLGYHRELELVSEAGLHLRLTVQSLVDDGPFYLRFLVAAEDVFTTERGLGFAERVVPAKVDRPWQRPFVRMRTFATGGDNSMWLPLFSGPRRGRFERLLNHWRTTPTSMEAGR